MPELVGVAPRYDPTVIPIAGGSDLHPTEDIAPRLPPGDAQTRFHSVYDYHEAYKSGRLTPSAVVDALLPLVRRDVSQPSPHSTAWLDVKVDLIRAAAAASTQRWKDGKPLGVLDGVPVAVKDEMDLAGHAKSLGTTRDLTGGKGSPATSFCVAKWEEAGAIVMGKLTMHELGLGGTNNNPNHGTPRNPHNAEYYTGGSSGGSAYAVGAGLLPIALGADGGGSIRLPVVYCGIFGLKPSHGRVSGRPTPSLAPSVGVLGPMAANIADLEIAYRIMAQPDPEDPVSALFAPPASSLSSPRKVLGVYKPWFDRAEPVVRDACQKAIDYLTARMGYAVVDVALPLLPEGQSAHALTILAEVGAAFPETRGLTPASKVLISVSSRVGAVDFLQAQKVRTVLMEHLAHLWHAHPGMVLVTPTAPNAGWPIAGDVDLPYGMIDGNMSIRIMEYAWLANFAGCPAIQAPVGYAEPERGDGQIPLGLMGMGEWGSEDALIAFGYDVEGWLHRGLEGGRRRPAVWVDTLALVEKVWYGMVYSQHSGSASPRVTHHLPRSHCGTKKGSS